jgi:hypothetical protein
MRATSTRLVGGRGLCAFLVVLMLALPCGVHAAGPADTKTRDTEMKARETFAAGHYDQALELFARLYAETLHPVYLRNIGRCHQKMREPQKAIDAFHDYLAKSPKSGKEKIGADERTEIEGYIKEMEALRDEQARAAAVPPPPPVVPLPPDPSRSPTAPPPPGAPPPAGPDATAPAVALNATAPPPGDSEHHPIYTRWWFWTAIGVVVVGGVVGAVLLSGGSTKPPCIGATGGCK